MASTKKGNILEFIRSTIQNLASVTTCEVNSTRALHTVAPDNMPFVNITSFAKYNAQESGTGSVEMWDLSITISIISTDGNAEDIRGDIKEAISVDLTQDGNATDTTPDSYLDIIDVSIPAGAQGVDMDFLVKYFVEEGKKI